VFSEWVFIIVCRLLEVITVENPFPCFWESLVSLTLGVVMIWLALGTFYFLVCLFHLLSGKVSVYFGYDVKLLCSRIMKYGVSFFLELHELFCNWFHSKADSEFVAEWAILLDLSFGNSIRCLILLDLVSNTCIIYLLYRRIGFSFMFYF
jgi:hypothetical protein